MDHIIPFSRSFDDSYANKVLVLPSENQNKGNCTPYEYFQTIGRDWTEFSEKIRGSNFPSSKKNKLLTEDTDFEGFKERNLNDTAYISRAIGTYLEHYLSFADHPRAKRRVVYVKGAMTYLVRNLWQLNQHVWGGKNRSNDRHHAMDAIIVAALTHSTIQKISDAAREEQNLSRLKISMPYEEFAEEAHLRVFGGNRLCSREDVYDTQTLRKALATLRPSVYQAEEREELTPLFVSRMPERRVSGQAHEETIRSLKTDTDGTQYLVVRTSLSGLSTTKLENMWGKENDPKLYKILKKRLEAHDDNPKKAFAEPVYKPGNAVNPVRSIKVKEPYTGKGVPVHKKNQKTPAYANNASIIRTDVFTDPKGKLHLVPLYVADINKPMIPNEAIVANKTETTPMDEDYTFLFSLYKNDLVRVTQKKQEFFGYYVKPHSKNASIILIPHDRGEAFLHLVNTKPKYKKDGKLDNAEKEIGAKTALSLRLYTVDVLGNYHEVTARPKRRALSAAQKLPAHQR